MPGPQIKISANVDQASFRAAQSAVDSLVNSVSKLNTAMGGVSKTTANMGQGSSGSAWQSIKQKVGLGGQGKNPGIVGQILGDTDASSIGKMAQSVDQAFSKVSSRIKTFVSETQAQINKLNGSISKLGGGAGGGNGPSGYSYNAPGMPSAGFTSSSGGYAASGGLNYGGGQQGSGVSRATPPAPSTGEGSGGGSGGGGGLGWRGRSANALIGGGMGSLFGQGTAGTVIGGMMGETGISKALAPFMGGIGVGAAVIKGYDFAAKSFETVRGAQIGWTVEQPFERLRNAGGAAGLHAGLFNAIHQKDLGYVMAYNRVLGRKDIQDSITNTPLRLEQLNLEFARTPVSLSSGAKNIWDKIQVKASSMFQTGMTAAGSALATAQGTWGNWSHGQIQAAVASMPELPQAVKDSVLEISYKQGLSQMGAKQSAQLQEAINNDRVLNPMLDMTAGEYAGNSMNRVRVMRSLGMTTGVNPKTGRDKYWEMEANLAAKGLLPDDMAQARMQILQAGAGYERAGHGFGREAVYLSAFGGLNNAVQLTQAGSVLGGSVGAGGAFYKQVQHSIGKSGLDVGPGKDLFADLAKRATSQGMWGEGDTFSDYASVAASVVGGGVGAPLDAAQQYRRSAMLPMGADLFNKFTSGTMAPLYQATSTLASIKAAGSWGETSEILKQMGPELLTSAMRGKIPDELRFLGVNEQNAKEFLRLSNPSPWFEVGKGMHRSAGAQSLVDRIKTAGSATKIIMEDSAGFAVGSKERAEQQMKTMRRMGAILSSDLGLGSTEAGVSVLVQQLTQESEFGPLHGGGVGGTMPKGLEKTALKALKTNKLQGAAFAGSKENQEDIGGALEGQGAENIGSQRAVRSIRDSQFVSIETASTNLVDALTMFAGAIKNYSGGSGMPQKAVQSVHVRH